MGHEKINTRILRTFKKSNTGRSLQMLTCYDFQSAQMLAETDIDMLLVGDSLGNVVLGYENTIPVTLDTMAIFAAAVKRGAPNKFVVADMPFGTCATKEQGLNNAIELFSKTKVEALKIEGAHDTELELIKRLTEIGIPVMGHIGLTPQSVHEFGGHYMHGKDENSANRLQEEALKLEKAGVFSIVIECVESELAKRITKSLSIPTIGIGAGGHTDGQVLVINDLLRLGKQRIPKFCTPVANLFEEKKELINSYLIQQAQKDKENA